MTHFKNRFSSISGFQIQYLQSCHNVHDFQSHGDAKQRKLKHFNIKYLYLK